MYLFENRELVKQLNKKGIKKFLASVTETNEELEQVYNDLLNSKIEDISETLVHFDNWINR